MNIGNHLAMGIILLCNVAVAMQHQPQDPLRAIDYTHAFEQEEIYQQFSDLMTCWHCDANVFAQAPQRPHRAASKTTHSCDCLTALIPLLARTRDYQSLAQKTVAPTVTHLNTDEAFYKQQVHKYVTACMNQLGAARRTSILRPVWRGITALGVEIPLSLATTTFLGKQSFGGSFSVFAGMGTSAYALRDIVNAMFDLYAPPVTHIDQLETLFACTKCFIPHKLWAPIIANFTFARTSADLAQLQSINFIEFALTLSCAHGRLPYEEAAPDTRTITEELNRRIDAFFEDYEPAEHQKNTIKYAVGCFVDSLINHHGPDARYQFMLSSQGLGKSEFVKELNDWIQELIPHYVYYQNCSIHTSADLEGGRGERGVFLDVLSNQLKNGNKGALVLFDEPVWIGEHGITGDAKRTFNGSLAEISTKYFGSDAVLLPLPPMLIFVNSNNEMSEDALKSRFDVSQFPKPLKRALIKQTYKEFENNYLYAQALDQGRVDEVKRFLEITISNGYGMQYTSFRDIKSGEKLWNLVVALLSNPAARPFAEVHHVLGGTKKLQTHQIELQALRRRYTATQQDVD